MARGSTDGAAEAALSSVERVLLDTAQATIARSREEMLRAVGQRGHVYLTVDLCLGDDGEPLWVKSAAYFEQMLHRKDAARERSDG